MRSPSRRCSNFGRFDNTVSKKLRISEAGVTATNIGKPIKINAGRPSARPHRPQQLMYWVYFDGKI